MKSFKVDFPYLELRERVLRYSGKWPARGIYADGPSVTADVRVNGHHSFQITLEPVKSKHGRTRVSVPDNRSEYRKDKARDYVNRLMDGRLHSR